MRVVLGTSALLISVLSIPDPRSLGIATPVTLIRYSLYGLLIYHFSVRRNPIAANKLIPWIDLLWYVVLIAFASNAVFYYFFFFTIIVASFNWGLTEGLRLTLASAAIYTIVGVVRTPHN